MLQNPSPSERQFSVGDQVMLTFENYVDDRLNLIAQTKLVGEFKETIQEVFGRVFFEGYGTFDLELTYLRKYSMNAFTEGTGGINAPSKPGDAGFDLRADHEADLLYGDWHVFETAAVEIPEGHCGLIIGRSSLNGNGVFCVFGLIDSGFRGKIRVMLYTIDQSRTPGNGYPIHAGDRIAQLVITPYTAPTLHFVASAADLSATARGTNGFGSTGK